LSICFFSVNARRGILLFARQRVPRKPLANDLRHSLLESVEVVQGFASFVFAVVVPKRLFVQVPEQVVLMGIFEYVCEENNRCPGGKCGK
jgi:hypothetical protein